MSEFIIYEDPDAPNPVQVTLDGDTVWLTQAQMAELFGRERSVITKHVRNVFRDGELNQEAVRAFFAQTAADGKTYQTEYYNLDVIASVIAFYAPTENEILRLTAQNDITTQSLTGEGVGFHETIGYSTPS